MILDALFDYYQRRQADPDPGRRLPAFGFEQKEIGFILELSTTGRLTGITETRTKLGNRHVGIERLVPKAVKRASNVLANLFWDNAEYVLGAPDVKKLEAARQKGDREAHYLARLQEMRSAFRARIAALPQEALRDVGVQAALAFLDDDPMAQAQRFTDRWTEISTLNPILSLRLVDDVEPLICQRPGVQPWLAMAGGDDDSAAGPETPRTCLITGQTAPVARLHPPIKNVWGAQTSGANIVSFNLDAFASYGHTQGENAPVSKLAAFGYTSALNGLLARDSPQRMQVGDASTVFWAQRADPLEDELAELLGASHDDPDAHARQVRAVLESVHTGAYSGMRGSNPFFILSLTPNAARIGIRFWHAGPLEEIAARVAQWFSDLSLIRGPHDPEFPALFRLLTAIAVQGKADNIPPRLGGDLLRSIFLGTPFPVSWLNAAVQRCRAERQVTYLRACAIKACLNRSHQLATDSKTSSTREIKTMLDTDNPSTAYRLGRLFATLEKIQEEASPGLNATIRERYYGAASSTPVAVFTTLMRLKNHHLAKIASHGRVVNFERLIGQIMSGIEDFPAHLPLAEQGRFAVGYYHQRQDFFTRHEPAGSSETRSIQESH